MDCTKLIKEARRLILTSSYKAHACHIGSALSCIEIIIDLYFNRMKSKDIFIFSKASGVAALYSTLVLKGIINENTLASYLKDYPLASKEVPGVFCTTGSLGHGLPIAVGVALADRTRDIYCLLGDGDIDEGTTWESILFASHHKLSNLKIIVDRNGYQACGKVEDILDTYSALSFLGSIFPIEIVDTVKGKGIDFMENNNDWHYKNLDKELLEAALCQI